MARKDNLEGKPRVKSIGRQKPSARRWTTDYRDTPTRLPYYASIRPVTQRNDPDPFA